MQTALHNSKSVIIWAGDYVASVVWHNIRAHPDKNAVFCDFGRDDAALQTFKSTSHSRAILTVQPPALFHSLAIVSVSQRLHMFSHVLEWQFIQRGLTLLAVNKINQPSILGPLHNVTAN